ncbi:exonuclease DPD1, chloroplastic/mitochondrial isoform X1 [Henckelia pumila]|uniref:exonuclease DPD1, chloroplastic/mitochondrial isoform X1 n=1 Tax=Henckelia pumila TaxID=405737 RepID=UPI003C6DB947
MRTAAMCFSLLQLPRCKIQTLANSWWGGFFKLSRTVSSTRVLCTDKYELERGQRWTRRTISTDTSGSKEKLTRKTSIRNEIISESKSIKLNTCKLENIKSETDQYYNDLAKNVTIICFDIETTGLSREYDRIIEIAFQDLRGGENSTFQTLVNPEREVTNARFHGISTHMVKRSNVPRMKDLIPIILQYVESRQIPGGVVLFIAHNGRTFDVPFLKNEFSRSSHEIPKDWLFADTLPLARALMKSKESKVPSKISLQALREHYNIPLVGSAHRALSDVHSLALVLQRLTYELKVPISDLIRGSFQ